MIKPDGLFGVFELDNNCDATHFIPFGILLPPSVDFFKSDEVYDKLPITVTIVRSGRRLLSFKLGKQPSSEATA